MSFLTRFRRAAKTALYVGIGPKVAEGASTFAIVDGLGGGAPAPKRSRRRGNVAPEQPDPGTSD